MGAEANMSEQTPIKTMQENVEALLEAARYDDMGDITSLTSAGVSLNSKDLEGRITLHMSAANGHLDIVEYLIGKGADLNASNVEKNIPLHWTCLNGHIEVVKTLITAGTSLSALNNNDRTPVDEAINRGKKDLMDAINADVT